MAGSVLAAQRPVRLQIHKDLAVALAVPEKGLDTRTARKILPEEVSRSVAIAQAGRAAALVHGLVTGEGDLIGYGMDDQLAVPHRKHLIPGYESAVAAGKEAGAYGVTISGAGSSLLAIASRRDVQTVADLMVEALLLAGNSAEPYTPDIAEKGLSVS